MKKLFRKKRQDYRKNRLIAFLDMRKTYIEEMTED